MCVLTNSKGTHEAQNILVSNDTGEIRVTGDLINGSTATGILAIAYSLTNGSNVRYQVHTLRGGEQSFEFVIERLAVGEYVVSVFVLGKSRPPLTRVATKPKNVHVSLSTMNSELMLPHQVRITYPGLLVYVEVTVQLPIEYDEVINTTDICITCTFLDSSATDCLVVVHQRISQLNSSGLMNILIHKLNRVGDIASDCIEVVSLEDYQFRVIGGKKIEQVILQQEVSDSVSVGVYFAPGRFPLYLQVQRFLCMTCILHTQ